MHKELRLPESQLNVANLLVVWLALARCTLYYRDTLNFKSICLS